VSGLPLEAVVAIPIAGDRGKATEVATTNTGFDC
jgi:hypothetical protein